MLRLMRGQADRAGVQLRGLLPRDPLDVIADRRALKQLNRDPQEDEEAAKN